MSTTAFVFHLGGGLYMDSNGDLHQAPPPNVPVYEPGPTYTGPGKVAPALGKVKDVAEQIEKDPAIKEFFAENGLDLKWLGVVSAIAKIASVVAPVLAAVAIAIDLAKIFGLLKDGPDPLELLVKQRFEDLEKKFQALSNLSQSKDLSDAREAVSGLANLVRDYTAQLKNANPTIEQLEFDRTRLILAHSQHLAGFTKLMDPTTWLVLFDHYEHSTVWPLIPVLHTESGKVGEPPMPAFFPPAGAVRFDHRLMVPLASYAASTYLATIQGIEPEYRTTGEFRNQLRTLADHLEELALNMRRSGLAKTVYKPQDFSWIAAQLRPDEVNDPLGATPEGQLTLSPTCSRWPVGALDLCHHNEAYFADFKARLFKADFFGWPVNTKYANMDFRWLPPAKLKRSVNQPLGTVTQVTYHITNPEECAAAANAQAEADYVELLAMSGYFELLRLSVMFRHAATEPQVSQTVRPRPPLLYRDPQPAVPVEVQSAKIFGAGVIKSSGSREQQQCLANLQVKTQATKRARPISYRVVLRTLRAIHPGDLYLEPTYSEFHRPFYEADPEHPGFQRLAIFTSDLALDDHLLLEGSSPRQHTLASGTAELTAHTFDWWIPVKPPYAVGVPFQETEFELHSLGWLDADKLTPKQKPPVSGGAPIQTLSHQGQILGVAEPSLAAQYIPELSWKSGVQDWDGERRDPKQATVQVKYSIHWWLDRLQVVLENRLQDRNYVVYVVIEEKFGGSGTVLHTAIPIPMNGQLTYIPQQFFDDERNAIEQAGRIVKDYMHRHRDFAGGGELDPAIRAFRPGDLWSGRSVQRALELAQQHNPELLRRVQAEHRIEAAPSVVTEVAPQTLAPAEDQPVLPEAIAKRLASRVTPTP